MANETILVVDDVPVNLRVAAATLRSNSYRVYVASSGEQALAMVDQVNPALILLDLNLPDMGGLDVARRLKADPLTRDIVILALTAAPAEECLVEVAEAGCEGYVAKPFDPRVLAQRVATFLRPSETDSAAAGPPVPEGILSDPEMDRLRRNFLTEGARQCRRLMDSFNAGVVAPEAKQLFHKWIGAAGALGCQEIARLSGEMDKMLRAVARDPQQLRSKVGELLGAFENPPATGGPAETEAARLAAPAAASIRPAGPEPAPARRAAPELPPMRPMAPEPPPLRATGPEPPSARRSGTERLPVRPSGPDLPPVRTSRSEPPPVRPSGPEPPPVRPTGPAPEPARTAAPESLPAMPKRVLIADDDLTVRTVMSAAFRHAGFEVVMAESGTDALDMARKRRAPAAVLDVNMPGISGFEVLAKIREEKLPIRVILVTARQQSTDVLYAFKLGTDDYVIKPFNPAEVVARLSRLLERWAEDRAGT